MWGDAARWCAGCAAARALMALVNPLHGPDRALRQFADELALLGDAEGAVIHFGPAMGFDDEIGCSAILVGRDKHDGWAAPATRCGPAEGIRGGRIGHALDLGRSAVVASIPAHGGARRRGGSTGALLGLAA